MAMNGVNSNLKRLKRKIKAPTTFLVLTSICLWKLLLAGSGDRYANPKSIQTERGLVDWRGLFGPDVGDANYAIIL